MENVPNSVHRMRISINTPEVKSFKRFLNKIFIHELRTPSAFRAASFDHFDTAKMHHLLGATIYLYIYSL